MKALTIWQPWASLLACGAKQYETRSWATKYRGPIAIHAGKKFGEMDFGYKDGKNTILDALRDCGNTQHPLPLGAVIATAELVNCWYIVHNPGTDIDVAKHIPIGAESMARDKHAPDFGDYFVPTEREMFLGDWTPGRYAWEFANVKMLNEPIPAKGMQGLWNWEG